MHEWGLTRRLIKLVEDEAQARQLAQVKRVRLATGVLNDTEREALRFNFKTAAQGTVAQDAELDIDECPAQALCPSCLREVMMTHHDQVCPHCHTGPLTPIDGETLRITELVAT
jgi:hydrogenase nickel incorporation protein HypA/HybF